MLLQAVRGQVERLGEADDAWRRLVAQPEVIVEDTSTTSQHQIEDMINSAEQHASTGRYQEALTLIDKIHGHLDEMPLTREDSMNA